MNENQYGNFTCVTKFVKFSYWFFVICKNYKFGYRVRFRIFDFYVFFNFGYGSEIGNFAEVYPHFLSLLFYNHMVISQGYRAVQPIFSPCAVTEEIRGTNYIFMLNVRNWGAQSSARFQHPKNAVLLKQRYGITGVDLALMCTVTSA